jgi:hypothetical protein
MRLTKIKLNDGDLVIVHYHYNLSSVASNIVNTLNCWDIAQLAERCTVNAMVGGSSPSIPAIL